MAWLPLLDIVLFVAGAFLGAVVAGLAGFAFGLMAAAIWLHMLQPAEVAALIVGYALVIQGASIWKLRHAIDLRRLAPLLVGGALGVPLGVHLLHVVPAGYLRIGVGAFLLLFVAYSALRPDIRRLAAAGRAGDSAVGLLGGILGGATGLAGILPVIWCTLRGWSKDEQRAVFQPVAVALFVMSALWLGATGALPSSTLILFGLGLPAVLAGTWLGLRLYGRLSERGFRQLVLLLLALSGVALLFRP